MTSKPREFVTGFTLTLLSKLVIGNCTSGGVGVVSVTSGTLFVTNAAHPRSSTCAMAS